jgi:DNA-binding response OmpR family regulator
MIRRSQAEAMTKTVYCQMNILAPSLAPFPLCNDHTDTLSILIVESYEPNIRLFTELSKHVGIDAVNVSDLRSANVYLENNHISAILLGHFGSHAVGASWTRQFRFGKNSARRCPIFAMSDCTSRRDVAMLRGAGVSEIIATPINIDAFFDAMDAYLVPELEQARERATLAQDYVPAQAQFRFA